MKYHICLFYLPIWPCFYAYFRAYSTLFYAIFGRPYSFPSLPCVPFQFYDVPLRIHFWEVCQAHQAARQEELQTCSAEIQGL